MSIKVNNVYIYCPASIKSGGPELLHQLSAALNGKGITSYMVYYGTVKGSATPADFKKYETKSIGENEIVDHKDNIVIVPEAVPFYLEKFSNAQKAIWWLSVDNFTKWATVKGRAKAFGIMHALSNPLLLLRAKKVIKKADVHFCQSEYARDYVTNKGFVESEKVYMLSDYISEEYLTVTRGGQKKDIIAYFPRKGYEITKHLMDADQELKWVPIENMTSEQVRDLLLASKVYVDFGNFPGKDRVPREAAYCGCCIITGKNGAAAFLQDITIPEKYKFSEPICEKKVIIGLIRDCMMHYESHSLDFEEYRTIISREKMIFLNQVNEIFEN